MNYAPHRLQHRLLPKCRFVPVLAVLLLAREVWGFSADSPITPGASKEAQSLMAFFDHTYGQKIISGQQDGWWRTNGLSRELNYITNTTGKLPALLAMDLTSYTDKTRRRDNSHRVAQQAIAWYKNRGGIVELCCHWHAPANEPAFYSKDTTFDINRAVTVGTPEYDATLRDLDTIAAELEVLRDAHVPVLWRPLHEANGRWFWWGTGGPEPFKKLWRMMYENFTEKHHLNNLIWVFSPGAETDLAAWYPGDPYVDIIGQDHYPMDGNHGSARDVFDELNAMIGGTKLVGLGENGPIPDPTLVQQDKAGWLFFTTWSGSILFEKTTAEQLRTYYNNPYVLNLGDLPDLKHYPFKPAGEAAKLAFRATPTDCASDGTWRSAITVNVEDKNGRTVRDGSHSVSLQLKTFGTNLSGTLTTTTINGVATFPDIQLRGTGGRYKFMAMTEGLRAATSDEFHVGPGDGLTRECWVSANDFSSPPTSTETLGSALEIPVTRATNFSERIRAEIIPPESGDYQFSMAAGGVAELWLSSNASATNAVKIAVVTAETKYRKWPHASEADSTPVTLKRGERYYLEIRQWQKAGSTQLHVRWKLPDGTEERPIPAFRFARLNSDSQN